MKKLNVTWEGVYDDTGYLMSFAKSLAAAVKSSPWAEYAEDIVATSGFAFRMWVNDELCPSSTSVWTVDMQKPWVENGGFTCEYTGRYWGQEAIEEEKRLEAIGNIKRSIDRGVPAISWDIGIPAWGLIIGYDDETQKFFTLGTTDGEGEMPYDKLGKREIPFLSVLTITGTSGKAGPEILRDTMKLAAAHLKGEEWSDVNPNGLNAYPALMKHFEPEFFKDEEAWNRENILGSYGPLKYYAWKYFEKNGQTQLAQLYKAIHAAWMEAFQMNKSGVSLDADCPNAAESILARLKSAMENETRALKIMADTINV